MSPMAIGEPKRTEATAKTLGFEAYTVWRDAEYIIPSQWGTIAYRRWCDLEAERIGNGCTVIERVRGETMQVAVFGPKRIR